MQRQGSIEGRERVGPLDSSATVFQDAVAHAVASDMWDERLPTECEHCVKVRAVISCGEGLRG